MRVEIDEDSTIYCDDLICEGTHRCHGCPLESLKRIFR